mmetsp:Transcript_41381/g.95211  ORF Transcript_41381/g.95211 Transcript_41381/m.95211 type:complete len:411 (+) Transcript_41381:74-1306(+)
MFAHVPVAPIDPILGTTQLFNAVKDPKKINLGVGAYRNEQGKPYVLNVIKEVEKEMLAELGAGNDKEYSTIDGPAKLKSLTQELCFGADCPAVKEGRIASVQALSGTGALRVCCQFIHKHLPPEAHEVWYSDPTWGNHITIFEESGLTPHKYPYWKKDGLCLDFQGMLNTLSTSVSPGSLILLHSCAHNPTGIDPSLEQWKQVAEVMKKRRLIPLLDSAYQGYASGDLEKDAQAIRLFASMGFEFFLCQSFAKNLGLYGERIGMLHVVCSAADHANAVLSQLKMVIRPMYSNPPVHGAHLVMKVLGNKDRFEEWRRELKEMAGRIYEVRSALRNGLESKGTPGKWNHITDQIGMFSFTGLSETQCDRLIKEHHIYLLKSGRISLAGLNKANMKHMIDSVDEVVRFIPSKL